MKLHISKIILIIFTFYLTTCQIWEANKLDFNYPLNVGRSWTYEKSGIIWGDDTDTIAQNFLDTVVTSTVIGSILSKDSIYLIAIKTQDHIEYLEERDTGLFIIAHNAIHNSGGVIPKKAQTSINVFNESISNSRFNNYNNAFNTTPVDSIIYYDPPRYVYQYPLKYATLWCYAKIPGMSFYREVIGTKEMQVEAGIFNCYHIKFRYDTDNDGIWDEDLWIDDYVSKEGLIKRVMTCLDGGYTDSLGNILGTKWKTTISLINYSP